MDPRLRNAAASTYTEGRGADGGFASRRTSAPRSCPKVFGEDSLIARTDRMQSSVQHPHPAGRHDHAVGQHRRHPGLLGWRRRGHDAVQAEARGGHLKAHKLAVLVPVTEELLEDAPAMDAYLRRKAPEKMDFKLSDALVGHRRRPCRSAS
jgi:hypothetical protein